jgi:hypothetical protein
MVAWQLVGVWGIQMGQAKRLVASEDWDGPEFKTCANAAWVCRAYQDRSRRREQRSFSHHAEVAVLPPDEADALPDWCEETPKPHPAHRTMPPPRPRCGQHDADTQR